MVCFHITFKFLICSILWKHCPHEKCMQVLVSWGFFTSRIPPTLPKVTHAHNFSNLFQTHWRSHARSYIEPASLCKVFDAVVQHKGKRCDCRFKSWPQALLRNPMTYTFHFQPVQANQSTWQSWGTVMLLWISTRGSRSTTQWTLTYRSMSLTGSSKAWTLTTPMSFTSQPRTLWRKIKTIFQILSAQVGVIDCCSLLGVENIDKPRVIHLGMWRVGERGLAQARH